MLRSYDFYKEKLGISEYDILRISTIINSFNNGEVREEDIRSLKGDGLKFCLCEGMFDTFKKLVSPFEYDDTAKVKSSKLGSKKSSKLAVSEKQILELCKTAKSLKEIAQYFGYKDVYKFKNNYINSLLEQNKLQMTIPDKPKSRNQKYVSKS